MTEPKQKRRKLPNNGPEVPQCSECGKPVSGSYYTPVCVKRKIDVCHTCVGDFIKDPTQCPWCYKEKSPLTKFEDHFQILNEDEEETKEEKEATFREPPVHTCSHPQCEQKATIGYYCCRGEEYKRAHCLKQTVGKVQAWIQRTVTRIAVNSGSRETFLVVG